MNYREVLCVEIVKDKKGEDVMLVTRFKANKCTGFVGSYKGQEARDMYKQLTNLTRKPDDE